jgi:hypothetical protein
MKSFLTRPKRKSSSEQIRDKEGDDEPTEVKLAILASLHPKVDQETLLDVLLAHNGAVDEASASLCTGRPSKKSTGVVGSQQSLRQYAVPSKPASPVKKKLRSKKGSTLHLYDPEDVAEYTPCTIIHNFLPPEDANDLLRELLDEAKTFEQSTFKLFDNVVSSPHTSCFFVQSFDEIRRQKTQYHYNGARLSVSLAFVLHCFSAAPFSSQYVFPLTLVLPPHRTCDESRRSSSG